MNPVHVQSLQIQLQTGDLATWALPSRLQDVTCRVMEGQGLSLSRL